MTIGNKDPVTGAEMLQIAFIVLKLIGEINWNWFWVLSPLWIAAILIILKLIAEDN